MRTGNHTVIALAALTLAASSCADLTPGQGSGRKIAVTVDTGAPTRGLSYTTDNLKQYSFLVDAYLQSTNRYGGVADGRVYDTDDATDYHFIKGALALYDDSSHRWNLDDEYIWRNGVPTVFWASCPLTVNGQVTRTLPSSTASDEEQLRSGLSYELPSYDGHSDAARADDILVGLGRKTWSQGSGDDVKITFSHALSAIRFDISGVSGVKVTNIALGGVYLAGDCSVTPSESPADNVLEFDWTPYGDKGRAAQDYVQADFTSGRMNPASTKCFFMVPQTMTSSAVLEVTFETTNGDAFTRTAHIQTAGGTDPVQWLAGKYYTYGITQEGEHMQDMAVTLSVQPWLAADMISTDF